MLILPPVLFSSADLGGLFHCHFVETAHAGSCLYDQALQHQDHQHPQESDHKKKKPAINHILANQLVHSMEGLHACH